MAQDFHIPTELKQRISSEQAYHYRIVPVKAKENYITFRTDQEALDQLLAELKIVLDSPLELEYCSTEELQQYLFTNYRKGKKKTGSQLETSEDFLEKIILDAKSIGSSDIHFEPYEQLCRVRFRLDGKLLEQYTIPLSEYPTIINKIKIRADLDIAEKRLPQDGRITVKTVQNDFDIRVSSLPTLSGEKLVLRILSKDNQSISLDSLGLSSSELGRYREGVKNPHGIVLISGPTGSGKTTTLYATLKELNDSKTNILTVEDPIEYTLEGINQVQLRENIGLDFASTLRTFLRQDPDIIMVGEIRDVATANMAIRAALTGHLVLSTIHTNSAWATISRLIDMGIAPYLIASTLNMSVAQRLVRLLCEHCKTSQALDRELLPLNYSPPKGFDQHYEAVGCHHCHHTGYHGRKALYEILPIGRELAGPIKENVLEIDDYLKEKNISTLRDNAVRLVQEGKTSIEEVYALLTE